MRPDSVHTAAALKERALAEGFSLAGISSVDPSAHREFFASWIAHGRHGEMGYLARPDAMRRRGDLRETLRDVRSCLVVAHEYARPDQSDVDDDAARAVIARYARGDDYHDVIVPKLERLLGWLTEHLEGEVRGRAYVDTGPILERELARRAGLGWFGRNTMLIHPERGSYFFLGVLLLDVDLPADPPFTEDRCGTCRACLDACPTGALLGRDADGAPVMDARRCISYLTIELRGEIPRELRAGIGNRVFGCDICQEVCPWNERFAHPTTEPAYTPREGLESPALIALAARLLAVDDTGFREMFRGSPISRARREGMLRNVCVALGNWGSEESIPTLERALRDSSPLVRSHAAWALGQVGTPGAVAKLAATLGLEGEDAVRREIEVALGLRKLD